jgi:superfamily II DNA or RNA helicase
MPSNVARDPNRYFSGIQRRHLYVAAGGICARCKNRLGDDWQAHHEKRHADGGVTQLPNGVALCRACHIGLHRKFTMFRKIEWQEEAKEKFFNHAEKSFLAYVTPGGGKTVFAGFCAQRLLEDGSCDFTLIVVPNTVIKGDSDAGFLGEFSKIGIEITTVLQDGKDWPRQFKGAVITYQQLPNILSTIETWVRRGLRIFTVADEIHHASDQNVWGAAIERLADCSAKVLAMTGTPFRGDGRKISFVRYNEDDKKAIPDFRYVYKQAVADNVCRAVEFITDDGLAEWVWDGEDPSKVRVSEAEESEQGNVARTIFNGDSEWLRRALEKVDACLSEYRTFDPDAAALIVCMPSGENEGYAEKYLRKVARQVARVTGEKPVVVSHDDQDSNAEIERFRKSTDRYICAVRKISEGVDIKRIRVVLIATNIKSDLLFVQVIGRAVRVDDPSNPGTATVFIPKFQHMVEWARTISEDVEAAYVMRKQRESSPASEGDRDDTVNLFTALRSTHEDGGAISDFGDQYSSIEIDAAELFRSGDPHFRGLTVTQIAYILRKANVEPDPSASAQKPLQIQKKQLRTEVNRLVRTLAFRRNAESPDFKQVWIELHRRIGAKNIDDLHDNYSIEVMSQALSLLAYWLGQVKDG